MFGSLTAAPESWQEKQEEEEEEGKKGEGRQREEEGEEAQEEEFKFKLRRRSWEETQVLKELVKEITVQWVCDLCVNYMHTKGPCPL